MPTDAARTIVAAAREVVDGALARLAADAVTDGRIDLDVVDREQQLAYDLASAASRVAAAEEVLAYGERGDLEARLTLAFAGEVAADLAARMVGREGDWGLAADAAWRSDDVAEALAEARSTELLESLGEAVLANPDLPRHLSEEMELVRGTFKDFAESRVRPVAEEVHRQDADIPDEIIAELGEMGCFGLSIPEAHGGFAEGESEDDFMSMVVVTEELSRGSLGVAGSLITRPEIISKAIAAGGTEEQKAEWLPRIASGELMCGVAVTEPDFGSDVAGIKTSATRDGDEFVLNGVKTWCTFGGKANLLLVLARTDPDRSLKHKGLSMFVVEKPSFGGHEWSHTSELGGRMEAKAIPTIGYRGMHSFEISFDDYRIPASSLVGGEDALGRGFYLQMTAFANGRLQTAARATGVMQAAFEAAVTYARERHVFDVPLGDYGLTRTKLGRMAAVIAASRAFSYRSAQLLGAGAGQVEAAMVKSFSCLAAEWLTREAMQIHGGYGYAEEYAVSRYFVDARVLSIFEGADEVLALRVIIRQLLADASGA
ncbi:acyl-CoA dehydrogenase family protein [Euzebya sp.]|uniref:acyl-CoA dehydrogenase family protein n=1 Tax=Euzebya sp. TaxID=1971409 RepID=UPI0035188B35